MQRNAKVIRLGVVLGLAVMPLLLAATEIELPPDTSVLRSSALPGYALAQQKCGICHSADYINYQPPGMNQVQWTAEMKKMQHSYGAPISSQEIALIGAYLAVAYGSAKATDASVVALSGAEAEPAGAASANASGSVDVTGLLNANACLGCHAIDNKVVGPAFDDVAAKYAGDANARSLLAASIQQGGTGKWGQVAMPAMPNLSAAQAEALADFVLQQ